MNNQSMGMLVAALSAASMFAAPVIAEPATPNFVMIYAMTLVTVTLAPMVRMILPHPILMPWLIKV